MDAKTDIDFAPETVGEEYAMLVGRIKALNEFIEISIDTGNLSIPATVVQRILGIKKKGET